MQSEFLKSLLLGALQGVTEFLPVSSSGHLAVLEIFAGIESNVILLNVLLHAGTLAAICIYYWGSLKQIVITLLGLLRNRGATKNDEEKRNAALIGHIIFADAVTVAVALLLYKPTRSISSDSAVIGWFLVLTALMLILTRFLHAKGRPLTWKDAIIIGFFQGIAVLPGISRSGATIFAALMFTSDRKGAVRFSFLIAIPVLLGATIFEAAAGLEEIYGNLFLYMPGTIISFITGLLCLRFLEKITVGKYLHWFAFYLVPVGLALVLVRF